jgi:hypothetical protein
MTIWRTPERDPFDALWPAKKQLQALSDAAAGRPAQLHAMIADLTRIRAQFPKPDSKAEAIGAEYVGLWSREADRLEAAGKTTEALLLRIEKGLVRT